MLAESLDKIGSTAAGMIVFNNPALSELFNTNFVKNIDSLSIEQILLKLSEQKFVTEDVTRVLSKKYSTCLSTYSKIV